MEISSLRIPDHALVIRGGKNHVIDIQRGIGTHPDGITDVLLESAEGVPVAKLAQTIPHRQIGAQPLQKSEKQVVM